MSREPSSVANSICIVVGLESEAKLARRLSKHVLCSGGRPEVAAGHAQSFVAAGAETLMSFGIAGGLHPDLPNGTLIVADEIVTEIATYPAMSTAATALRAKTGRIFGGLRIAVTPTEKAELYATYGAVAVDLESGPVARVAAEAGIPFIALRAIADSATDTLPPAALLALLESGRPHLPAVFWSVLRNPMQIPHLIQTARQTNAALKRLRRACRRLARY